MRFIKACFSFYAQGVQMSRPIVFGKGRASKETSWGALMIPGDTTGAHPSPLVQNRRAKSSKKHRTKGKYLTLLAD
jgi:hypothetical protein